MWSIIQVYNKYFQKMCYAMYYIQFYIIYCIVYIIKIWGPGLYSTVEYMLNIHMCGSE